ncbi:Yhc1p [Sporobolomyces koalae]|uniref:Yhc1p n=1 Tax=Sporobolomyces koalae TaxID=500713 RepID=UPI00317D1138
MPSRYLCDYCDVFLTHDSASVRRAHNAGRNHLSNVRDYYASLGNDRVQELIDQICAAYEHGGGGQARILQMGPDGLPMGAPAGAIAMGGNQGAGGPMMGGMPPPMMGGGPPPMRFAGPPSTGFPGSPAPGLPPPGAGAYGSPAPPLRFPPPAGLGAMPAPPPGFRPPPGFAAAAPPNTGATISAPPAPATASSSSPPPPPASNAKLINGLNPERAKMLGLI